MARNFQLKNMPTLESNPLLIIGEASTLNRFNYENLPPYTKHEINSALDLANLHIKFNNNDNLEKRQIFLKGTVGIWILAKTSKPTI